MQWIGFYKNIKRYWNNYGGISGMLLSPYFHLAVLFLIPTAPYWRVSPWENQVLSVIPNLIGFTLAGMAIFLSFGNINFQKIMADSDPKKTSPYIKLVTTFLHFIVIQLVSLFFALLANGLRPLDWSNQPCLKILFNLLGYGLFLYSIFLALAAGFAIYRLANLYAIFIKNHQDSF